MPYLKVLKKLFRTSTVPEKDDLTRAESEPKDMPEMQLTTHSHPDVTKIDLAMMARAIKLAEQAAAIDEVPVGAVVYKGNKIIAEAYNLRESTTDPVAHAELMAISQAGKVLGDWRLTGCTLAVTLEPCPMCAGALVNARLSRMIYGATDPKAGGCESLYRIATDNRLNHEVEIIKGVFAGRCSQLLKDFFRKKREARKERRLQKTG